MDTLFLVEDNQDNADLILDLLGDSYRILWFREAASALAHLQCLDHPLPHLFVLDISLPGMDGISLLRAIRADNRLRHIPAVALTAHAMRTEKERLIAAGFNGYLSKPITDESLLRNVLEQQRALSS